MITMRESMYSLIVLACVWIAVHGYGSGAPDQACVTLTPGHVGLSPQTGPSPFSVTVSKDEFRRGEQVKVRIRGGDYKGILLQARRPGQDTPVGHFINPPNNTQVKTCSKMNDCVTHDNTENKTEDTEYTWEAPDDIDPGDLEFKVTVAQNHDVYWTQIASIAIIDLDSGVATPIFNPLFCLVAAVITLLLYSK